MTDALPIPLTELTPDEVERLRPHVERLALERRVRELYTVELPRLKSWVQAMEEVAEQVTREYETPISDREVRRIVWGG